MGFEDLIVFGYVVFIAAVVVGIWLFLRYAFKGELRKGIARLFASIGSFVSERLRRFLARYAKRGDYADERESIFRAIRFANLFRRKRDDDEGSRRNEIPWNRLRTNRDRVRYLYRHFILFCMGAGFPFNGKHTPNRISDEILVWDPVKGRESPFLTDYYNEARYGPDDRDLPDELLAAALEKTERVKENG